MIEVIRTCKILSDIDTFTNQNLNNAAFFINESINHFKENYLYMIDSLQESVKYTSFTMNSYDFIVYDFKSKILEVINTNQEPYCNCFTQIIDKMYIIFTEAEGDILIHIFLDKNLFDKEIKLHKKFFKDFI